MERSIKFRAWNKKLKEMETVLLICFVNRYVDVLPFRNLEGGLQESWSFDDIELLQYTGLKDRNGKEVYEGHIVKIDGGYCGDYHYNECLAEIKWSNDESCFYPHNHKDRYGLVMQDYYNFEEFEIIGNIYENPELLENT